jgi:hypothetical protein
VIDCVEAEANCVKLSSSRKCEWEFHFRFNIRTGSGSDRPKTQFECYGFPLLRGSRQPSLLNS